MQGHTERLGRVAFHPMGRHIGTASFDETWRLWDVETSSCLVEQEGHSRAVYTVAFHPDGSLAASGGLDAVGEDVVLFAVDQFFLSAPAPLHGCPVCPPLLRGMGHHLSFGLFKASHQPGLTAWLNRLTA